jgi:hypothetical protein
MLQYIIKVVLSATLIVIVSEASKKSSLVGGIFASVPLISVLALIWLYIETRDTERISQLSTSVFWLVIPSLSLFIILPVLLKMKINFYLALSTSIIMMILFYYLIIYLLDKFGIHL